MKRRIGPHPSPLPFVYLPSMHYLPVSSAECQSAVIWQPAGNLAEITSYVGSPNQRVRRSSGSFQGGTKTAVH